MHTKYSILKSMLRLKLYTKTNSKKHELLMEQYFYAFISEKLFITLSCVLTRNK